MIFFSVFFLFTQAPDTLWTRTYGGTGWDEACEVESREDGGYIVIGETQLSGNIYAWLLKMDADGDTLWTKIYNGEFWAIEQTSDRGYVIAGSICQPGENNLDAYLLKTDPAGDTLWSRCYGGALDDIAYAVQPTFDGGYILAGQSNSYSDVYVVKTDSLGNMQWQKTYGGTYRDYCFSAKQVNDGGYIFAGYTAYLTDPWADVYIIRTDSIGDTLSTRTYGTPGNNDEAYCVQCVSGGGYIVAGWTCSFGQGGDIWLLRLSDRGDSLWTRTYGGLDFEYGSSVQETGDGGFVIAGYTRSFGAGYEDVYVVKTDSVGDTLWTKTIGGAGQDEGYSISMTADNGCIIAGRTNSYGSGSWDVYLVKLAHQTGVVEEKKQTSDPEYMIPTVFHGSLRYLSGMKNCKVFDIMGRQINPASIGPGIYFIEINGKIEQKVIIAK
ncbi:MAG TPA: hypothetical protein VF399_06050 [bacterium]